ncbi:YqgQ family protein [Bacillus massiliglaciei]|uniref:YqgQ family protein n=1 Tax=Bacillus massiliglaciei TaxID=1816693 RepID=UPI000AA288ED|nr:YqgQ family protein [Bacillus massiliglaciei]
MNTVYDIQQLLKRFGTIIYTGNRLADLELMETEIRELYQFKMIDVKEFQHAVLVLRQQIAREKEMNR